MPDFIEIEETFVDGRTYVRTYVRIRTDEFTDRHLRPALLGRLCLSVDLKMGHATLTTPLLMVICRQYAASGA